jgi:hypothetical protein
MDEVDGFLHRESRHTKYYKLVIFIVDTIFILSLGCSYCSNFTVAATDRLAIRRIKGDTEREETMSDRRRLIKCEYCGKEFDKFLHGRINYDGDWVCNKSFVTRA